MKILHVIPSISLLKGGPTAAVLGLCKELARVGNDVTLVTTDEDEGGLLDVPLGIPVEKYGFTTLHFHRQTNFYCFSWPLTKWLAENIDNYDFVHVHAVFSYPTIPASLLAHHNKVPYVLTPHGILMAWGRETRKPWLKKASIRLVEKNILQHASILHYTSERERDEMPGFARQLKSAVIPLGIDMSPFAHLPPRGWLRSQYKTIGDRPIILFLSRLDPNKGLELLLESFQQIVKQKVDAVLVIAGDGVPEYVDSLHRQIRSLSLERNVIFTGFLQGDKKIAALADADLYVLSSRSESFGMAVVEAMACGLPVIISNQIGIHRQVSDAGAGLVVPWDDSALTRAITKLSIDRVLRQNMGKKASILAEEQFSIDATTCRMIAVYERLINAPD